MNLEASFTINGVTYELADPDTLSFTEMSARKRLSKGLSGQAFEDALLEMDPDAWFALLLVSMRRERPDTSEAELGDANFVTIMMPIAEQWHDKVAAAVGDDAGPPPATVGEANGATPTQEETIREEPGVL